MCLKLHDFVDRYLLSLAEDIGLEKLSLFCAGGGCASQEDPQAML